MTLGATWRPRRWPTLAAAVVFGVLVVGGLFVLVGEGRLETARERAAEARTAYEEGDFEAAVEAAQEAIGSGVDDAATHAILGKAQEALGNMAEASEAYRESLAVDASQVLLRHDLAVVLVAAGDFAAAEQELRTVLLADPELAGSRLLLGDVLAKRGAFQEAKEAYQTVIDAAPDGVDVTAVRLKLESL
jgi:tetratricopeptide (TPR) repeat protein